MTVYVGKYEYRPVGVDELPKELRTTHPKDIREYLDQFPRRFWTNNPLIVSLFPADEVVCCTKDQQKPLNTHPNYRKWKHEFDAGEFWTFVGDDW